MGFILCDLGRHQESETAFKRSLELKASAKAFSGLSLALNFQRMPNEAYQAALDGLDLFPGNVQLKVRLATISETLRKGEDAMRIFREIIEVDPDNIEALSGVGRGYMRDLHYAEALHYLNLAVGKEGNIVPALCTMVSAYIQMQDLIKANETVDRIAEIDPEVAEDFRRLVDEFSHEPPESSESGDTEGMTEH
jgi:tetratricopeptide (TPR) repeat protein